MRIRMETISGTVGSKGAFILRGVIAALACATAASAHGFAQTAPSAPPALSAADIRSIPVRAASLIPSVGEQVLDENGAVDDAFFTETRICTVRGCRVFIFDNRSGALINNDGRWSAAYAKTDRGREVIRINPFTDEERPKPAASDKALESSPSIRRVRRSEAKE